MITARVSSDPSILIVYTAECLLYSNPYLNMWLNLNKRTSNKQWLKKGDHTWIGKPEANVSDAFSAALIMPCKWWHELISTQMAHLAYFHQMSECKSIMIAFVWWQQCVQVNNLVLLQFAAEHLRWLVYIWGMHNSFFPHKYYAKHNYDLLWLYMI